jgi:glc operon protein GlcG
MKARDFLIAITALTLFAVVGHEPAVAQARGRGAARPAVPAVTFEQAEAAMDAAEAEARANTWRLTIVVADSAGVPIYLRRLPGASSGSYDIAMAKVRTSLASGMHTGDYARTVREGRIAAIEGGTSFEGGLLIRLDGKVVGAMSASGASAAQDAQAVRAGLAAIGAVP